MKIIFVILLIGVASVASQINNGFPVYPNLNNLNDPNHPCNLPGANCKIQSRFAEENSVNGQNVKYTRVCDEKGCIETRVSNDSPHFNINLFLLTTLTLIVTLKSLM